MQRCLERTLDLDQLLVPGDGRETDVDLARFRFQVELGDRGVAGAHLDVDAPAARAAHARDRTVFGAHAHVLVGGKEGLVDVAECGVRPRHQDHQRADPGARTKASIALAGAQLDLDPVLAVLDPARGEFDEDRAPAAAAATGQRVALFGVREQG
jgi:hypothetical protein